VIDHRILLTVEDNDRDSELVPVALDPLNRHKERFRHFDTEEGDHESIFEDIVHELVIFGESSGIDHRVDDEVFQFVSNLLHNEQLHGRYVAVLWHAQ